MGPSWDGHGTVMGRSWDGHGTVMRVISAGSYCSSELLYKMFVAFVRIFKVVLTKILGFLSVILVLCSPTKYQYSRHVAIAKVGIYEVLVLVGCKRLIY